MTTTVGPLAPAKIPIDGCAGIVGTGVFPDKQIAITRKDGGTTRALHVTFVTPRAPTAISGAYRVFAKDRLGAVYWPFAVDTHSPYRAFFTACAVEDDTQINFSDCSGVLIPPLTLDAGETLQVVCATHTDDPTGTAVWSTNGKPFGLVSGNTAASIPRREIAADMLMEMMFPMDLNGVVTGTEFYTTEHHKPLGVTVGDMIRILAAEDDVDVTIVGSGIVVPDLAFGKPCPGTSFNLASAGDHCDVSIRQGARITTALGKDILVAQYMRSSRAVGSGDPALMLVVPTSNFRCQTRFHSFEGFHYEPLTNREGSYVNIVAPVGALASTLLDGARLDNPAGVCAGYAPAVLPGGTHAWTRCRLPDPGLDGDPHRVEGRDAGQNPVPVAVYVYGQQDVTAYAYAAGLAMP